MTVKILDIVNKFQGVVFNVEEFTFEREDGVRFQRQLVTKAECVVCLVYHVEKEKFLLAKEFRVGELRESYGLVAGMIDEGEDPADAGTREIQEEAGYENSSGLYLGYGFSSSGFTNEKIHFYYVEVSGKPNEQQLDHDERIELHEVSLSQLQWMIVNNEITSNHAQTCYLRYCLAKGQPVL